ncbi:tRNA isopentenyl-2-thiomethyl-A-37 hydroxylase MiaE [Chondromyces apiculatus]|uniref:tRNA-(Ms[2]io[6]A)-hydroxylase n=1 Tax=Chondromyces apiculatus DSM 436 TaxID=1192034 RepID=A0A017T9V4_9BACT|nr:tRNA isopentenyl-2-thiomethyl-A-37 hydroxylase MiaE [Chondromyces apiculatus]EYF05585.1 tRNA-(ms[2]io[6]A)-hydroxylase [Chondromyces apiculatus DSM 436]
MLCLTTRTDPRWAEIALADLPALLTDHAHCEMKAASNALSLGTRCASVLVGPEASVGARVLRTLVEVAEEELRHYRALLDELGRRDIPIGPPEVDAYAAELRKIAGNKGGRNAREAMSDRLLIGALIEARSCERFRLLADALSARQHELAPLYEDLFVSEARHYRTFTDLAADVRGDGAAARARLGELARAEGEIAARLGAAPAIHG